MVDASATIIVLEARPHDEGYHPGGTQITGWCVDGAEEEKKHGCYKLLPSSRKLILPSFSSTQDRIYRGETYAYCK